MFKFADSVRKALLPHGGGKTVTEAAVVTCVKLCKAATYINILDSNNVIFSLVQSVISDLKQLLFKAFKKRQVVLPILQTEESHRQLMDVHTGRHPCIRSGTIPFISLAARWSVRSSGDFRRPPKV